MSASSRALVQPTGTQFASRRGNDRIVPPLFPIVRTPRRPTANGEERDRGFAGHADIIRELIGSVCPGASGPAQGT